MALQNAIAYPGMLRVRSAPKAEVAAAQGLFCEVINDQLTRMQKRGMERSVAVQQVLHRIASASARPRDSDVRKLMKSKQVSRSYAERALIVKSEILRLKMEGFDTLSAIEEITKKVKLLDCKRIRSDGQRGGEATGGEAKRHTKQPHTIAVATRHSSERVVFGMLKTTSPTERFWGVVR